MISLEHVHILQKKVESAVEKISQLQAENDALRTQCSELSNSLSEKTEQLLRFEMEQETVANGIMRALESLNAIENRGTASSSPEQQQEIEVPVQPVTDAENNSSNVAYSAAQGSTEQSTAPVQENNPNVPQQENTATEPNVANASAGQPQQQGGQFDIF